MSAVRTHGEQYLTKRISASIGEKSGLSKLGFCVYQGARNANDVLSPSTWESVGDRSAGSPSLYQEAKRRQLTRGRNRLMICHIRGKRTW